MRQPTPVDAEEPELALQPGSPPRSPPSRRIFEIRVDKLEDDKQL